MQPWKTLSSDGQSILIQRFNGVFKTAPEVSEDVITGAVVDVETTGLDARSARVIEIAVRTFRFQKTTGQLVSIEEHYTGLQDPGQPLSKEISKITGLTDAEVKDQKIDWSQVKSLLSRAEIIIAHNARFDRPFIEKELGEKTAKVWACSLKQLNWSQKGYSTQQLGILCAFHGFFSDTHRALSDVDALLNLLSFTSPETSLGYLAELYQNAHRTQVNVIAIGSRFETKDLLKSRGYKWDTELRAWKKLIYSDELPSETEWLESEVYPGKFTGKMVEVSLLEQFQE